MAFDKNNTAYWALAPRILDTTGIADFATGTAYPIVGSDTDITATLQGTALPTSGYLSGVYHFDGVNDYVQTNSRITHTNSSNLTVEIWFKETLARSLVSLFHQYVDANNFWGLAKANTNLRFWFRSAGTLDEANFSFGGFTLNELYCAHLVKSGADLSIYKNGSLLGTASGAYNLGSFTPASDLTMGKAVAVGSTYADFEGDIEYFAMHNEAWDASRVADEYALGADKGGLQGQIVGDNLEIVEVSGGQSPFRGETYKMGIYRLPRYRGRKFR